MDSKYHFFFTISITDDTHRDMKKYSAPQQLINIFMSICGIFDGIN